MVNGGAFENFRAKRGAIPKIEGEGGASICTGLLGGGHSRFLRQN